MIAQLVSVLVLLVAYGNAAQDQTVAMTLLTDDHHGWTGQFKIPLQHRVLAWELKMDFNTQVTNLQATGGDLRGSNSGRSFELVNALGHGSHNAHDVITVSVTGSYTGSGTLSASGRFVDLSTGPQAVPVIPAAPTAGDLIKFNFPMAHSVSLLAWGYLQWTDAYTSTGLDGQLKDALKWGLDYFLKCHVAPHELYVQVGDADIDHPLWGRPENMTMRRPAYKITEQHPGSDVAAETAAAFAAGYLVFAASDSSYANTLLTHAKQLYEFAIAFPGKWTDSLPVNTYSTGDFRDEVFWAASWLFKATGEDKYKGYALAHKTSKPNGAASWEDKTSYADALLYSISGDGGLRADLNSAIFKSWLPGGSTPYTPGGLIFLSKWGALKNADSVVLVALVAADSGIGNATAIHCWAKRQIQYSLGDNPLHRSYVAGFGANPPSHYHHRPSSCPNILAPCGWESFNNPGPNPHILYGAMVGGPGPDDSYADLRSDYVKNEVALDYNAAFQSSVAGLIHLALHNRLPENCP